MAKWKMKINWEKTKVLVYSIYRGEVVHITYSCGWRLKRCRQQSIWGPSLVLQGSCDDEIENRIGAAARMVGR